MGLVLNQQEQVTGLLQERKAHLPEAALPQNDPVNYVHYFYPPPERHQLLPLKRAILGTLNSHWLSTSPISPASSIAFKFPQPSYTTESFISPCFQYLPEPDCCPEDGRSKFLQNVRINLQNKVLKLNK
jgi:hypothetical protein